MAKNALQIFVWQGQDRQQKVVRGKIEAASVAMAKAQLLKQGYVLTKIRRQRLFALSKMIKSQDIVDFTRQMATLLAAGVPLVQSFDIILNSKARSGIHDLIAELKHQVEQGISLSGALRQHPQQFEAFYCNLVYTGEMSGTLDVIMDRLAVQLEKTASLKKRIKRAMFYPMAVIAVALLVMAIMLIFVIPQFESMFNSFGANLPTYTLKVLAISNFVQSYWWLMILFGAGLIGGTIYMRRRSLSFRGITDGWILRLPLLSSIIHKAVVARFARTLATTFGAGIPLVQALQAVAGASGNEVYRKAILTVKREVEMGNSLQYALRQLGLFKPFVIQMIAIGEESGALEQMLLKVALIYEEEVDVSVDLLGDMLEPIMMVILGIMVAALVIAMYLPIFKLASVV